MRMMKTSTELKRYKATDKYSTSDTKMKTTSKLTLYSCIVRNKHTKTGKNIK